jgi:hypothetical protein
LVYTELFVDEGERRMRLSGWLLVVVIGGEMNDGGGRYQVVK